MRPSSPLAIGALLLLCVPACNKSSPTAHADASVDVPVVTRQQQLMATTVTITIAAAESVEVLQAIEAGFSEVARLTNLLSEFIPASEVSAVSRQAGIAPVPVSEEVFEVVRTSLEVSEASSGAFDVTWGALAGLWDFRSPHPRVPTPEEIKPRLALIDYRQIALDPEKRTVFLKRAGMRLGLGGIAKGYVVDRVSEVLKKRGYPNHLVVAGGEVFASGRRGDQRWSVGMLDPRDKSVFADLELENEGVTTSGNYERFFIVDGVRYHHIIDPRTGLPSRGVSQATLIAKTAFEADSYDTACVLLGTEKALALARERGFEVFLFDDRFATAGTPGFQTRLRGSSRGAVAK